MAWPRLTHPPKSVLYNAAVTKHPCGTAKPRSVKHVDNGDGETVDLQTFSPEVLGRSTTACKTFITSLCPQLEIWPIWPSNLAWLWQHHRWQKQWTSDALLLTTILTIPKGIIATFNANSSLATQTNKLLAFRIHSKKMTKHAGCCLITPPWLTRTCGDFTDGGQCQTCANEIWIISPINVDQTFSA